MDTVTVAAVNWILQPGQGVEGLLSHAERVVAQAVERGAEWIVLPECVTLEALMPADMKAESEVPERLLEAGKAWVERMRSLAAVHHVTLVAGTHFAALNDHIVHMCAVIGPEGSVTLQPKNNLTTYEREVWRLGTGQGIAATHDPRLGVLVCYDAEFPEAGRAVAESGAMALAVPAFTETAHGLSRVRYSALGRAVENQIFVVHASLGGSLGGEPVPFTVSGSAILAPPTTPFPSDGVLAITEDGVEAMAIAVLDFSALQLARRTGDVRNWDDRRKSSWNRISQVDQ